MKKIGTKGFKISKTDKKALEHYLLETPFEWTEKCLKGMINKAVKTIIRDWFEIYKSTQTGDISASYADLIPAIISMKEFKPYNLDVPKSEPIDKKFPEDEEMWDQGFDIEDYEEEALKAYYTDYEKSLEWFFNNKVVQRRKAFVKEEGGKILKDPEILTIPAHADDLIDLVTKKTGYKNRAVKESEIN